MKAFLARALGLWVLSWLGGCGSSTAPSELELLTADFPVRVRNAGVEFELANPPRRVLPANATWIDSVSLLMGPERVVALPREARGYSRLGTIAGWDTLPPLDAFDGERVLALHPDLVLTHAWQSPETIATLRRAGVPVLVAHVPRSWSEVTSALDRLGTILGEQERAAACLRALEERRSKLGQRAAAFQGLKALSYTNLGAGPWTSGAKTTAAILLELAGLRNAAGEAGLVGDVPADAERILALSPDVFLVGAPDASETSAPSEQFLLAEPALLHLPAITERRIVTLPPALFTTASSELLRGAEQLVETLEQMAQEGRLER